MPNTDIDLAYLAGLIDGEGHLRIGVKQSRRWHQWEVLIVIGMCDREPLDWCAEVFGGHVTRHSLPKNPRYRRSYTWRIWGDQACALADAILPLLKLKTEQAQVLVDYARFKVELKRTRPGPRVPLAIRQAEHIRREVLRTRLRGMTKRGVSCPAA